MDKTMLELLRKVVADCRQTRGDGRLDRLRDLADEVEARFPEVKLPPPVPAPAAPAKN